MITKFKEAEISNIYKSHIGYKGPIDLSSFDMGKLELANREFRDILIKSMLFDSKEERLADLENKLKSDEEKLEGLEDVELNTNKKTLAELVDKIPDKLGDAGPDDLENCNLIEKLYNIAKGLIETKTKLDKSVATTKTEIEETRTLQKPTMEAIYEKANTLLQYLGISPPKRTQFKVTKGEVKEYIINIQNMIRGYNQNHNLMSKSDYHYLKESKKQFEGIMGKYGDDSVIITDKDPCLVEFMRFILKFDDLDERGISKTYRRKDIRENALEIKERAKVHLEKNGIENKGILSVFYATPFNDNIAVAITSMAQTVSNYLKPFTQSK